MPQLMPIMWVSSIFMFTLIVMIIIDMYYYYNYYNIINNNNKVEVKFLTYSW